MSNASENAKAKLAAAKRKAEQLRLLQEEAARELAEAEALEEARERERERVKAREEIEALHRSTNKERAGAAVVAPVARTSGTDDNESYDGEELDAPESAAETRRGSKGRRKRLGLHCFNCNRYEGHYLLAYRRLWYSFIIGMTFGLAIIFGPYRCQCCGSSRLMMSNLLHPKYYVAVSKTRSKRKGRSRSRSSRR